MRFRRFFAIAAAALVMSVPAESFSVCAADERNWTDFSSKWPDKFFDDNTVEKTETAYKSHDLNIRIDRHEYARVTGDVDENGEVQIADAILALRYQAEDDVMITVNGLRNADVNEDGLFTATDTSMMLGWLSGNVEDAAFFEDRRLVYFVVDCYVRSVECFRSAFAQGEYHDLDAGKKDDTVMNMAKENNAVFAINGDFISFRNDGITWRNGVCYRETPRYCKRGYYEDVEVLFDNGEMNILTNDEYCALTDEEKSHIWQTVNFSPTLLRDGEIVPTHQTGNILNRHPRTGIGYFEPGHYCFVLAEGRQPGYSDGVLVQEFAQIFKDLGCVNAFNSDGGASSVMALYGKQVNQPAWRGRATDDIFYLVDSADIVPDAAAEKWLASQQTAE